MSVLTIFIQKAIVQGICILYGALGEIMTEKSGNLNLGIPGIMYMGGIAGLMGAFLYEKDNPNPNAFMGVLISFVCAFACAMIGGLIYSILTITLRVNQNVTGLALTIFGTGFGNFFGGSISKLAGGVGQISVKVTGSAYTAKIPGLSKIPVIGPILFNYGFMTYLCVIVAVVLSFFLFKTRSFGHLISDFNPVAFSIPLLVDSAMTSVSMEAAMGSICGLKSMLIQIPTPAGDVQTRPLLPFPPSWRSATARVPWGAPCSARRRISLFVESVSSKNATCVPAHFVWIVLSSSSFESTSADPFKIYPLFRTASIS